MVWEGTKETKEAKHRLCQKEPLGDWAARHPEAGLHSALLAPSTPHSGFVHAPTSEKNKTISFYQLPKRGMGRGRTQVGGACNPAHNNNTRSSSKPVVSTWIYQ